MLDEATKYNRHCPYCGSEWGEEPFPSSLGEKTNITEAIRRLSYIIGHLEYKKLIHYKEEQQACQLGIEALERERARRKAGSSFVKFPSEI